jgi:drug/metabolite transporter (DMT)-like permease
MTDENSQTQKSAMPHILLILTVTIWAGNAIAGKFAVGHISPMVLTFSRWSLAFLIVTLFAHKQIKQDWPVIRQNAVYFLVMGTIGYSGFNVFLYSALHHTSAINVAIEQSAIPLMIFIGSLILYRQKFGWFQITGFALTLFGVAVVITGGDLSKLNMKTFNRGDIMMFFAAVCYSAYSIGLKQKPEMHWLSLLTAFFTGALISSIVAMIWEISIGAAIFPTTTTGFAVVAFTAILPSIVAQASFIEGVGKLGANAAGIYINLLPIIAAIMAVLLLKETLGLFHIVALMLVIAGITLVQRK